MKDEIVLYRPNEQFQLEVQLKPPTTDQPKTQKQWAESLEVPPEVVLQRLRLKCVTFQSVQTLEDPSETLHPTVELSDSNQPMVLFQDKVFWTYP